VLTPQSLPFVVRCLALLAFVDASVGISSASLLFRGLVLTHLLDLAPPSGISFVLVL
jgi:hypothetical protein